MQVRINEAKEMGTVLMALMESQPPERFVRDLAIVNFGLHYRPDQRLKNDVGSLHSIWSAHRVRSRLRVEP